jgi:hypothetical protein
MINPNMKLLPHVLASAAFLFFVPVVVALPVSPGIWG